MLGLAATLTGFQPTTGRYNTALAEQISAAGDEDGEVLLLPTSAAPDLSLSEKQVLSQMKPYRRDTLPA